MIRRWLRPVTLSVKLAFSKKFLLYTNVFVSFSSSAFGDFVVQQYEISGPKKEKYNLVRTRNMSITGITSGILNHYWYIILEKVLPGRTILRVAQKIIIDQFVYSPINILNMFIIIGILEKSCIQNVIKEVKEKSLKLYLAETVIWPPAQFINFYFVPLKYRLLFDNAISLGYDVYYSAVKYES